MGVSSFRLRLILTSLPKRDPAADMAISLLFLISALEQNSMSSWVPRRFESTATEIKFWLMKSGSN